MKCSNCSFENLADARFCENCGHPLEHKCPNCGYLNSSGAKFCRNCGFTLTPVVPAPAKEESGVNRLSQLQKSAPSALQEKIRAASAKIEGERKPVTILFADIVGSTAHAERLDPEEWKEIVGEAHHRVSEAIYRYEGTIAQLLGDGVLAFFGAPITHEDDPVRAVRAALDIQNSIEEYSRTLTAQNYVENLQMRVGVNTGLVVVGNVGSDLHMEYLAIGDAVNLAARLQSAAEPGRVLVSESTARLIRAAMDLREIGEMQVKGKSEPVRAYEVVLPKAVPTSGRGIEGLTSPLVGRDRELEVLRSSLSKLLDGQGQIVAILGEAGLGKSRLVEEARGGRWSVDSGQSAQIAQPSSGDGYGPSAIHWLEGRSLSYGQTLSYWAIQQLIKADLGLSDADPEARIRVALRRRASALFQDRAPEHVPLLAQLLGLKLDAAAEQRIRMLDAESLKRQTLNALAEYFRALAKEKPTALVFEDFHWADPSTLEVVEQLLPLTDRAALMLLLPFRIERDHGSWRIKLKAETDFAHRYHEIALKPLSSSDSNVLVNNLLEVANLPEAIRRLILERSEGNPFYLEEIIRSLIEQGAIVRTNSHWTATADVARVEIPETLQGVLLARVDRLEEDVRRTLQLASVIGRSFLYTLLRAIAEAEQQLDTHLSKLQRADLVLEKARRPELEYIFKHSLTQEAAYNSLLVERRKEFHRRVGEALEQLFAGRAEEFYGLLAYHFNAAGDPERALKYFKLAGEQALKVYANEEAEHSLRAALALSSSDAERGRLLHQLARCLWHQSRTEEPIALLREAIEAYRRAGDYDGVAFVYARLARFKWMAGDTPATLEVSREGLEAVEGKADGPGLASLLQEVARSYFFNGRSEEGLPFARRAVELATRLGSGESQAEGLTTLGLILYARGQYDEARAAYERAVEIAEAEGLVYAQSRALNNLGNLLDAYGDFQGSRERYYRAADAARQMGHAAGELFCLWNAAWECLVLADFSAFEEMLPALHDLEARIVGAHKPALPVQILEAQLGRFRGDLQSFIITARQELTELHQQGNLQDISGGDTALAEGQLEAGELEGCEQVLLEAIDIGDRGLGAGGIKPRGLLVALYARQGRIQDARRVLAEAIDKAGARPQFPDQESLALARARLGVAEKNWDEALAAFQKTAELEARMGKRWYRAQTFREWAEAQMARGQSGDVVKARELLRESLARFQEINVPHYAALVQARLQTIETGV